MQDCREVKYPPSPRLSKHTSAFLWGGGKSFVILMGVKYVFQIH